MFHLPISNGEGTDSPLDQNILELLLEETTGRMNKKCCHSGGTIIAHYIDWFHALRSLE